MVVEKNLYIGIDGGLKGGISSIDDEGKIIKKNAMPVENSYYDIKGIINLFYYLQQNYNLFVGLEDVHVIPFFKNKDNVLRRNNPTTMGKMFELLGVMKGILVVLNIEYTLIRAVTWQRKILKGIQATNTKDASIKWCQQNYPNETFVKNKRCRTPHDGITDSLCIANYIRLIKTGKKR